MRIPHILIIRCRCTAALSTAPSPTSTSNAPRGWEPVVLMSGKHYAPGPACERIGHEYIPADKSLGCRGNSGSVMPIPSSHGRPSGQNYGSVPPLDRRGPGVVSWTPKLRQVAKVEPCP